MRVLILDDDPVVGDLIELVAQSAGAATAVTQQAGPFLAAVAAWQPTHIVLDLRMPGTSGAQVLQDLWERRCCTRIVLTSGDGAELEQARTHWEDRLDIAGTLPKPFRAAALRALLA